jgi:hypothetical protein
MCFTAWVVYATPRRTARQGCVPLTGMVGYDATVPRFRGVGRYLGTPRGPLFRNSVGVGPPPRAVMLREFHPIPAVIPLIPGTMFRNSGGVGRTPGAPCSVILGG